MKNRAKAVIGVAVLAATMFSQADTKFPLRVDIDVSSKNHRKSVGAGADGEVKIENVQLRVKLRKASSQKWDETVKVELYIIGKQIQTGNFGVIDVIKKDFKFEKSEDNQFEFKTKMYSLPRTSGNIKVGGTYETYLVIVTDKDGNVIETRSGRRIKDEGIAFIRKLGPKTMFDKEGNVLGEFKKDRAGFAGAVRSATDPGDRY